MSQTTLFDPSGLPDVGEWETETEETDGMEIITFTGSYRPEALEGPGNSILCRTAGYILHGLDRWKQEQGVTATIEPPETIDDITDNDRFINDVSISDDRINLKTDNEFRAWGVPPARLEAALRFVTYGSKYSPDDTTIEVVDSRLVVTHKNDSYLFGISTFEYELEDYTETTEIAGFEIVNETNEKIIEGLDRIISLLEDLGTEIVGYNTRKVSRHVFNTASGATVETSSFPPKRVTRQANKDPIWETEIEVESGETDNTRTYTLEQDELNYDRNVIIESPHTVVKKERRPAAIDSEEAIGIVTGYKTGINQRDQTLVANATLLVIAPRAKLGHSKDLNTRVIQTRKLRDEVLRNIDLKDPQKAEFQ